MAGKTASINKRLVIDASIAKSAGSLTATDHGAKRCRDFLLCIQENTSYMFVLTQEIKAEWNEHHSPFAEKWRRYMTSKRRTVWIGSQFNYSLRIKVLEVTPQNEKPKVEKDLHLIEAALETDRIVSSLDNKVRKSFSGASSSVEELKAIIWVNPNDSNEVLDEWLKAGAMAEEHRCLGVEYANGTK